MIPKVFHRERKREKIEEDEERGKEEETKKKGIQIDGFVYVQTFLPLLTMMIHDTLSLISSPAQLKKIIYSNYS